MPVPAARHQKVHAEPRHGERQRGAKKIRVCSGRDAASQVNIHTLGWGGQRTGAIEENALWWVDAKCVETLRMEER